jgi:hypothetical protein
MPNTWVTTVRTFSGLSNSKTPTAYYATKMIETHGRIYCQWCEPPYLKGLRIARHNKAVHLITQTLQANKHTRYYTLTNAGNHNNMSQEQTIPDLLIECTCPQTNCQCQAKLRPYILCVLGARTTP